LYTLSVSGSSTHSLFKQAVDVSTTFGHNLLLAVSCVRTGK